MALFYHKPEGKLPNLRYWKHNNISTCCSASPIKQHNLLMCKILWLQPQRFVYSPEANRSLSLSVFFFFFLQLKCSIYFSGGNKFLPVSLYGADCLSLGMKQQLLFVDEVMWCICQKPTITSLQQWFKMTEIDASSENFCLVCPGISGSILHAWNKFVQKRRETRQPVKKFHMTLNITVPAGHVIVTFC